MNTKILISSVLIALSFLNNGYVAAQEVIENKCSEVLKDFKTTIEKLIDDGLSPYQIQQKTVDTITGLKCDTETAEKTIVIWKDLLVSKGDNGSDSIVYALEKNDILLAFVYNKINKKFDKYYVSFYKGDPRSSGIIFRP